MEENDNNTDKEEKDIEWIVLKYVGIPFVLIFMFYFGVKMVRNHDPYELSKRFVRNNEVVKQKTGGIKNIRGFGGGKISGNSYEITGKVYGNDKNIAVTVYIYCNKGSSDPGIGCTIREAKYKNANDPVSDWLDSDWHEIEIGWVEKAALVFKE